MEYKFRSFEDGDYEFVYNLKKQAYQSYVEENFGEWNESAQREFFKKYIDAQWQSIKIIVVDGKDAGFFDDKIDGNIYEIANIVLDKKFQNKGIGTKILKDAIKAHKNYEIQIQCFKSNPVVELYKRLGFTEFAETNTHKKLNIKK